MPNLNPQPMTLAETLSARQQRRELLGPASPDTRWGEYFAWPGRIVLLGLLVTAPWLFGAVYSWGQFVIAGGLLFGLVMWWLESAFTLRRAQVVPYVFWLVAAGILLAMAQLIALPQWLFTSLAGIQGDLYARYLPLGHDGSAGAPRLTLDVEATWRYLRVLVLGAAALLLGARFFRRRQDVILLLSALTLNGVALAIFSMFQKLTFNGKIYWVYESIYRGNPYGPFVNRNNAAGYLLLCLAAAVGLLYMAWDRRREKGPELIVSKEIPIWRQLHTHLMIAVSELTAMKLAVTLACILMATALIGSLSRGGVLGLLAGAVVGMLYYGMARKPKLGSLLLVPMVAAVVLLTSWIGFYDRLAARFDSIDRGQREEIDARVDSWRTTIPMAWRSGWLGAGLGTYPRVHRLQADTVEKHTFLHAENQFVQTVVEMGLPGLFLLIGALCLGMHCTLFLLYRGSSDFTVGLGLAGVFLLSSQVVAGLFDFGWYVPANTVLFAGLAGAIGYHSHALSGRLRKPTWLKYEVPGWLVKSLALCTVVGVLIIGLDLRHQQRVDLALRKIPTRLAPGNLTAAEADLRIDQLGQLAQGGVTTELLNQLAELWVYRARLVYWERLKTDVDTARLNEELRNQIEANLWQLTGVLRIQEQVAYLRSVRGASFAAQFRQSPGIGDDLPLAREALIRSARIVPFQPEAQTRWIQLEWILGEVEASAFDRLDAAVNLAPTNLNLRYIAALTHAFAGQIDRALPHLRSMLELDDGQFARTVAFLRGLTGRIPQPVDDRVIADEILPPKPQIIYEFAVKHLDDDPGLRSQLLRRAHEMLATKTLSDLESVRLRAEVLLADGKVDEAIEDLRSVVAADANDHKTRMRLIRLLLDEDLPDEALHHAERLAKIDERQREVTALLDEARQAARAQRNRQLD